MYLKSRYEYAGCEELEGQMRVNGIRDTKSGKGQMRVNWIRDMKSGKGRCE
ncbi:hypothetical protein VCHA49P379_210017 [Vibrio chagasii]|nr:hypothetical protein VCHA29O37_300029 [Vibrio chagasii]CAH7119876.1 hypothetical protein VCHA49P379_210017 [Vibrio chagasii]